MVLIFKSKIMLIDYRSDTLTRPGPEMKAAMLKALLGDDVFGEDPTVNKLQEKMAVIFGMEAALFCPSGTMTNQIAIKCHTQPGHEVICDELSHIYQYEGGGIAFNAGCSVRLLHGKYGLVTAEMVDQAVNNKRDVHKAFSSLVSLENTSNRGGGACYDFREFSRIKKVCKKHDLKLHLDGARLFNALTAKKESPLDYGKIFDSISVCLSKGLGAPVGSVLLGSKEFIDKAKRIRKVFGGGMRQAGILAAAGIYALDHHIKRLATDHRHANVLADLLSTKSFVGEIFPVETNIIIFETKGKYKSARDFTNDLREKNILVMPISSTQVRMVTHLDITKEMVEKSLDIIDKMH